MSTSMSQKSNGKRKTPSTITRRSWSVSEEHALIAALKDIVSRGWKCDNGFKTGYLGVLEQHMEQQFPNTDLRATPHIVSKIHVWKKHYGSLSTMLTRSGFGWNETANTIDVEAELWDEYIKTDPSARVMRYKSWPLYNDWSAIFGKDRATGENAEKLLQAVNDLSTKEIGGGDTSGGAEHFPFVIATNDEETESMSSMQGGCTSTFNHNRGGKKKTHKRQRNHDDLDARIVDMMADMTKSFAETKTFLGELAQRIGFEHDTSITRKNVLEALSPMANLTVEDKIKVAKAVCNSPKELDIFFGLEDEEKIVMVQMILENRY